MYFEMSGGWVAAVPEGLDHIPSLFCSVSALVFFCVGVVCCFDWLVGVFVFSLFVFPFIAQRAWEKGMGLMCLVFCASHFQHVPQGWRRRRVEVWYQ